MKLSKDVKLAAPAFITCRGCWPEAEGGAESFDVPLVHNQSYLLHFSGINQPPEYT